MNASVPFFRAKMAPAALATAIGMAFAMSVPAQAQYTYPGTASSSGHSARISPMRAGARERADYGDGPAHAGTGNPSMHRGEACPPGTPCAGPVPANGGNSDMPSGGYGTHESYGAASMQSPHEANAIHPIAAGGKASISPVRAGDVHGALNYGPSQTSNTNFRNSVSGKMTGPNMNVTGQPTSFTGPTGKKVNMDGSQTITGPNGKKQTIGGEPDLNNLGGGYGHQKGSGIKQGMSYSVDGNGSVSGTRTGSAPGMASASGMNMGNGGQAGASFDWKHPIDSGAADLKKALNGGSGGGSSTPDAGSNSHQTVHTEDPGTYRNDMDPNKTYKVTNPNSHHVTTGDPAKDGADMGPTAGPGEIVSGTGQVVQPGKKKGQDTGGGQTGDAGTTNSGGRNAQGAYIAPSGQDNVKKPKEVGTLKMDYNGKNGAIDPKLGGSNGGGGG